MPKNTPHEPTQKTAKMRIMSLIDKIKEKFGSRLMKVQVWLMKARMVRLIKGLCNSPLSQTMSQALFLSLIQTSLTDFVEKEIEGVVEVLVLDVVAPVPVVEVPPVATIPKRLLGRAVKCEFCNSIEGVTIVECQYVCPRCFELYGTIRECVVIYENVGGLVG